MFEFMFGERRSAVRRLKKLCLLNAPSTSSSTPTATTTRCRRGGGAEDDDSNAHQQPHRHEYSDVKRYKLMRIGGGRSTTTGCNSCCGGSRNSPDGDDAGELCRPSSTVGDDKGEKLLLWLKDCCDALLKRLPEAQLNALRVAVESGGSVVGDCVPVEGGPRRGGGGARVVGGDSSTTRTAATKTMADSPAFLACRLWRWVDLEPGSERSDLFRHLPHCCGSVSKGDGLTVECCNPYHWYRIQNSEMSSAYSQLASERKFRGELSDDPCEKNRSPAKPSLDSSSSSGHGEPWCELAYWEERIRVGPPIPVFESWIDVFGGSEDEHVCQPGCRGVSLDAVAKHNAQPSEKVARARAKIGAGVCISRDEEEGDVWLYNLSPQPIFLAPSTLSPFKARTTAVHRLAPGYCVKAYDRKTAEVYRCLLDDDPEEALDDLDASASSSFSGGSSAEHRRDVIEDNDDDDDAGNGNDKRRRFRRRHRPSGPEIIPISFGKGWGPKYSRRDVLNCPCWLEIRLCGDSHTQR